ncbi:MAG: ATP-binding protein [Actinomycetota bacterium]
MATTDRLPTGPVTAERAPLTLPDDLSALGHARDAVRDVCAAFGGDSASAELVATELVSNAVRHGGPPIELRVEADVSAGSLRIAVSDGGGGEPAIGAPSATTPGGRGLLLVDAMSDRWGVERLEAGKRVWAVVHTAAT